jgi:epoxyqueuosine reductase
MDREALLKLTAEFSENSPTNYLSPKAEDAEALGKLANNFFANNFARNNYYGDDGGGTALNKDKDGAFVGMRFFMPPIIAVGSASDEGYKRLREPGVVGPHHLMPEDWLPGAKSVISLFLPFTERVIASNTQNPAEPSWEWLFTRVDGQQHLLATGALVRDALIAEGYKAVVPYTDDRYVMRTGRDQTELPIPAFSSNWSERHVGFLTGLGTFGRMTNFISRRGACGRLISIVTDWETAPDEKDYTGIYGYCSECGACYRACPGRALSKDGKDIDKCSAYLRQLSKKFAPRYGCGKCQSGLPCSVRSLRNPGGNGDKNNAMGARE